MTDLLHIKFGETHYATNIEQRGEKEFVAIKCGPVQEINPDNRHRIRVALDSAALPSCPSCKFRLLEDLSADLLNPEWQTDPRGQGNGHPHRGQ